MKKSMSVFSLFAAGAMVLGGAGLSHADSDELKISGFGSINFDLSDEARDNVCATNGGAQERTNCDELQFSVPFVEVDLEKTVGSVTVRLDLDFGVGGTKNNIAGDTVEQMRFDWAMPIGQEVGLTLTGGIFNSPVGLESQDSPDKLQVTNGQLFNMVPSNLAGLQLSAGTEMIGGSLLFTDDWRGDIPYSAKEEDTTATPPVPKSDLVGEENSIGATLHITPMPEVGLAAHYLSSGVSGTTAEPTGEDVLDIMLTGTLMPSDDLELYYALEYLTDELDTGTGLTLHAMHGKHGLTVRYDMVDCDDKSDANYCKSTTANNGQKPTTLTVAFLCSLEENLKVKLEWKNTDKDLAGISSTDATTLQFVALF